VWCIVSIEAFGSDRRTSGVSCTAAIFEPLHVKRPPVVVLGVASVCFNEVFAFPVFFFVFYENENILFKFKQKNWKRTVRRRKTNGSVRISRGGCYPDTTLGNPTWREYRPASDACKRLRGRSAGRRTPFIGHGFVSCVCGVWFGRFFVFLFRRFRCRRRRRRRRRRARNGRRYLSDTRVYKGKDGVLQTLRIYWTSIFIIMLLRCCTVSYIVFFLHFSLDVESTHTFFFANDAWNGCKVYPRAF